MEEILASIRRIIADEDTSKAAKPPVAPPKPAPPPMPAPPPPAAVVPPPEPVKPPPAPPAPANNQTAIDAMLADMEVTPKPAAVAPPPPPPSPKPVEPPPADILDLTEAMTAPSQASVSPSFRTIDAASDVVFTDRHPDPAAEQAMRLAGEPRRPMSNFDSDNQGLISSATMSAVDNAFNSLAHTVLGNNARTLEDLVKEMLRPMLKGWLDDNLPTLVERIVRAEIERVSRGRS